MTQPDQTRYPFNHDDSRLFIIGGPDGAPTTFDKRVSDVANRWCWDDRQLLRMVWTFLQHRGLGDDFAQHLEDLSASEAKRAKRAAEWAGMVGGRMQEDPAVTPTPGSAEAVKAGCRCPVNENNVGSGFAVSNDYDQEGFLVSSGPTYWIHKACSIHAAPYWPPTPPSAP